MKPIEFALLASIAVGFLNAELCPPVQKPPFDSSCKWEGIRDPDSGCIVDFDCIPTGSSGQLLHIETQPEVPSQAIPPPQGSFEAPLSQPNFQPEPFPSFQPLPDVLPQGQVVPQPQVVVPHQPQVVPHHPQPQIPVRPLVLPPPPPQQIAPRPDPQPLAHILTPAGSFDLAPRARPVNVGGLPKPSQFHPGPRGDGQSPGCASVHVPPTNYRCAGWSPIYEEETGCIDHYECIPAAPVPHIAPARPCPSVPRPEAHPLCKWTARIEPRTGCKAYYECRPLNPRGSICPVIPFPKPVSRCHWIPIFNKDTGCVILYKCSLVPDCPQPLGKPPAAKDGCIWSVITDDKGCDSEYKCIPHDGSNDAGFPYVKTASEVLVREIPPCDPRDPYICTGWREPMEWGCCARYRDFPRSHFRWHNRGCYCEPNKRRCAVERTTPGLDGLDSGNDQWTYCVPKETFDCYHNFFLKGARCTI